MKTTLTISLRMATKAYEAITDNRKLEEQIINDYPNTWIIETEDPQEHENLIQEVIDQLEDFGVTQDEYTIS